jgi:bifunctional DNA-binding transcriptional regulator/antitoxin component of YhaV-PrlF toxin-antitoxin module
MEEEPMGSNTDLLNELKVGLNKTETVKVDVNGSEHSFILRPLSSGELSSLQVMEKKNLKVKVKSRGSNKESINEADMDSALLFENKAKTKYRAISLSMSVNDEKITDEMVKILPPDTVEALFTEVVRISNLTKDDLTVIQSFQ